MKEACCGSLGHVDEGLSVVGSFDNTAQLRQSIFIGPLIMG